MLELGLVDPAAGGSLLAHRVGLEAPELVAEDAQRVVGGPGGVRLVLRRVGEDPLTRGEVREPVARLELPVEALVLGPLILVTHPGGERHDGDGLPEAALAHVLPAAVGVDLPGRVAGGAGVPLDLLAVPRQADQLLAVVVLGHGGEAGAGRVDEIGGGGHVGGGGVATRLDLEGDLAIADAGRLTAPVGAADEPRLGGARVDLRGGLFALHAQTPPFHAALLLAGEGAVDHVEVAVVGDAAGRTKNQDDQ